MFAKPVDLEAQPSVSKQVPTRGLMAAAPASLRNLMDKNQRPIIRWRRLRSSVAKDGTATTAGRLRKNHHSEKMAAKVEPKELAASNPLRFLQQDCPEDVLPLILAFAGPQTAAVLHRTNCHWKNIVQEEATWKVLCKELYKVRSFFDGLLSLMRTRTQGCLQFASLMLTFLFSKPCLAVE